MPFLTVGVEHTTSPLSVRERFALSGDTLHRRSLDLVASTNITEAAILSTCNRTEAYCFVTDIHAASRTIMDVLFGKDETFLSYIQTWTEMEAVEHLFRVAAGLESQVLGEAQILSQVASSLETAQETGSIGPNLHALFRSAISGARQARAGTTLGKVQVSLGTEAVHAAEQTLGTLADSSVLLVGGGEICRLVAEEVRSRRPARLYIANRTASVAGELAAQYGGQAVTLSDIPRVLPQVDMVVSATSAPQFILTPEDIPQGALQGRRPALLIFDLAIPRDIDPAIGLLDGVELHDLDTLLPHGITAEWEGDTRQMEAIIGAEVHEFMAWYLTRRVVPVISNLRSHVEEVSRQELKRVAPQLTGLTDREHAAVESLTQRLIDKMFHHLVVRLRLAAQTDPKLVDAAEFLFLHGEGGLFPHAAGQQTTPSESKT